MKVNKYRVASLVMLLAATLFGISIVTRLVSETMTWWTFLTVCLTVLDLLLARHFWSLPRRKPVAMVDIYGPAHTELSTADIEWLAEQAEIAGFPVDGRTSKDLHSWETSLGTVQPWNNLLVWRVRFFEDSEGAHAVLTDKDGEGTVVNWRRRALNQRYPEGSTKWLEQLISIWVSERGRR